MISLTRLRPFVMLLKVLVVLLAVDWWVAGWFFNSYISPRYLKSQKLIRDRTAGKQLVIVLDAMERLPPDVVRVAFVGDSTMLTAVGADEFEIPFLVRGQLRGLLRGTPVEPIHGGVIGLYASDALLWIDQLIGRGADVIVYGVALRAFPTEPYYRWVTRVSSELGPTDLFRLVESGATPWMVDHLSAEQIAHGVVHSTWQTYAYRGELRQWLWEAGLGRLIPTSSPLARIFDPPSREIPIAPRLPQAIEWTRAEYDMTNQNWQALDLIGKLCRRYRPGRCVMYASPINPIGREHLAEAGLYEEYLAKVQAVAQRDALIWRDYTDALTPAEFVPPMFGGARDPIHPNEQGRRKLARLLAPAVAEALRAAPAPRW